MIKITNEVEYSGVISNNFTTKMQHFACRTEIEYIFQLRTVKRQFWLSMWSKGGIKLMC